jgi:N-acylglucosamine 2-epimerase
LGRERLKREETSTDKQFLSNLREFYIDQLFNQVLPFWMANGIDKQYGGYFTCFNNTGEKRLSTDKYVWSQGRFIWIFATLAELRKSSDYLDLAKAGVDFLGAHCFLDDGSCAFLLNREGTLKEPEPGKGYSYSIYADCFVVLGFAKYAALSEEPAVLDVALKLYDSIINRIERNDFQTNPEPTPQGYKCHGIPMILLNVSQEMARSLSVFNHPRIAEIEQRCVAFADETMNDFGSDDIILEMVNLVDPTEQSLLTRYINPGHNIENMWFVLHQAMKTKDVRTIARAVNVVAKMFELGWDTKYGGLFHFVDREGGRPGGDISLLCERTLLEKLQNDWDVKLWWVHSEALYTTLLGYCLTGDHRMMEDYQKVHDYTFATFPHPNRAVGEWIQIRDRYGKPLEKVVALPVKDPFHIIRNFLLIIELLQTMEL